jgi:hypothetical protein
MTTRAAHRTRNRLILSARLIVVEHWPAADGNCPICKLPDCWALATASAYLDVVNDPFVPARLAVDVVHIDSRAPLPAMGATGGEPVDGGKGEPAE